LLGDVGFPKRDPIAGAKALWSAVEEESAKLDGRGRVLVRPSGTEPLLRVMVEAPEEDECEAVVERLVGIARSELA
jgi:phosphoglucosamine mutase